MASIMVWPRSAENSTDDGGHCQGLGDGPKTAPIVHEFNDVRRWISIRDSAAHCSLEIGFQRQKVVPQVSGLAAFAVFARLIYLITTAKLIVIELNQVVERMRRKLPAGPAVEAL